MAVLFSFLRKLLFCIMATPICIPTNSIQGFTSSHFSIRSNCYFPYHLPSCLVAKSCLTLCDPIDCSLLGSSVHGISQARILEWVSICFSKESSHLGIEPESPALAGGFFTTEPPGKPPTIFELGFIFISILRSRKLETE